MQAALHQNSGSTQVDRFLDLFEDYLFGMNVTLGVAHWPVERAEAAVFGTEIGVVDIAVDDVTDDAVRMKLASHLVGGHTDADQIVAAIQIDRFLTGHHAGTPPETTAGRLSRRIADSRYNCMPW